MPTTIESTGENERAQAERWARDYEGHATWAMLMPEERAERIAAMLPLVRDARKSIDDAHVALDVEVPRQVNGRTLSLVERAAILLQGQAYASDLFDKASDERDAARREIERLTAVVAEQRAGLLAAAEQSRVWGADIRERAVGLMRELREAEVKLVQPSATPAPLTASHGPSEDEALRWAEDVLDAAKPPEEADLDMSAAARAISPLVREAQAARRAPLTEDEARGFYVRDSRSYVGNCVLWWAKGRSGYTTHLDEAHVFTEEEAAAAQRNRETDVAMPVRAARAAASMQVDAQRLSRGDIPDAVRPEASPAVQDAIRGLERVAPVDVVPTLTHEEALRRLDALSSTAARHLSTARDWLSAYEQSAYRDTERDKMAAILRAYVAGLDTPPPVDVPHDLREAAMARWATPVAPVATGEPWTPKVGVRVATAEKLTANTSSWPAPDGYVQRRRPGVSGHVLFPGDASGMWWIHHDEDGCTAPYDADELRPENGG